MAGFLEVDTLGIGEAQTLVDRRVAQGQRGVCGEGVWHGEAGGVFLRTVRIKSPTIK